MTELSDMLFAVSSDDVIAECLVQSVLIQNGIEELGDGAACFEDGVAMVHGAGEIGVCKSDAAERDGAENFARREVAVCAEEKTRLRT